METLHNASVRPTYSLLDVEILIRDARAGVISPDEFRILAVAWVKGVINDLQEQAESVIDDLPKPVNS